MFPFDVNFKGGHAVYYILPKVGGLLHVDSWVDGDVTHCRIFFLLLGCVFGRVLLHCFIMGSFPIGCLVKKGVNHLQEL